MATRTTWRPMNRPRGRAAGRLSALAARVRDARVSLPARLAVTILVALLAGAVSLWWERRVEASVNPATIAFHGH